MNRVIPLILAFALLMEQMDATVISTSLPSIAADLETSPIALKLALTAYLVSVAIFIPLSGWIADRFGVKRVFSIAIGVFMAGSLACSVSGSLSAFVAARFLQGMGGAMMTPVSRLILVRGTEKSQLIDALAWLTIPALAGPVIGPPLGGFITTYFSWHWIFLINIPIGIAGIIATVRFLPELPKEIPARLDVTGFLLAGIAASGTIFGLSVISLPALPPLFGLVAIVVGLAAAGLYIAHSRRISDPILNLSLLRAPVYRTTVLGGSIFRIGNGALPFLLPLMLQVGFGLDPFRSGLITFVSAAGAIAMKFAVQRIFSGFGFKRVLLVSGLVTAVLIAAVAGVGKDTPVYILYGLLLVVGFTRSLFFTGLNALSFSELDPQDMAQATALNAAAQQLSVAAGVAMAGAILESAAALNGGVLTQGGFIAAFLAVGLISAIGVLPFVRMHPLAGSQVSRHGLGTDQADKPLA
jgi:EmrB/QacA subfamily drug resistance transporter